MPDMNKSHITIILDRSGSMASIRTDVIGAVNAFIDDQRKVPGQCTFTLVQFDDQNPYEVLQDAVPLSDAKHLSPESYVPRGYTPLLDCIGKGIVALGETLKNTAENDRPGKIIFVIETDGQENASKEYTCERVAEMVKHQTDVYKWQFVFLGANQDAIATGAGLNVTKDSSLTYAATGAGFRGANRVTSNNVARFRADAAATSLNAYSEEDRKAAMST